MKYAYVLERDPRFLKEIIEALEKIDPQLQVRVFTSLELFANWIQLLTKEGKKAIAQGGVPPEQILNPKAAAPSAPQAGSDNDQLLLLVSENDILGSKHLELLRKTQKLFVQKGLCTPEDPTAIVITAYDNPDFDLETVEDRTINNVIFKPFDKMILLQHLVFAYSGRHPPSAYTIHNMKTSAVVEMVKDVDVEAFSDVGFFTISLRPIPIGAVAKYYGEVFTSESTMSVFARCVSCEPHPEDPNKYRCELVYFGATPEQVNTFRKNAKTPQEKDFEYIRPPAKESGEINIVVIDPEEKGSAPLSGTLQRSFSNIKVVGYHDLNEFLIDLDPKDGMQMQKSPPAFPVQGPFKLIFNRSTKRVIRTEPEMAAAQTVFGLKKEEIERFDFYNHFNEKDQLRFLNLMKGKFSAEDEAVFIIKTLTYKFFVKCLESKKTEGPNSTELVEVTFQEMKVDEIKAWLLKASRLPATLHGIILHNIFVNENDLGIWATIQKKIQERVQPLSAQKDFRTRWFLISPDRKKDASMRQLGTLFSDIFYPPVERSYFTKKIYLSFPELKSVNNIELKQFHKKVEIQVGNPIKVHEISEAGLVMTYYRAMSIGSFRKFILWYPVETDQPVMLGACNFNKKSESDGESYENHFVFFGIQDLMLQNVRRWILDNYVHSKQGES